MPPSLTQQFAKKLPNKYLYQLGDDLPTMHYNAGEASWFNFLSTVDENRLPSTKSYAREEFHYIRYPEETFKRVVFPVIRKVNAKSFLDVGCGGGDKLHLVRKEFGRAIKVHGIEHDPGMAAWASLQGNVFCMDALEAQYGAYDIIYAYWPIQNTELMTKLVVRILDQMHPAATFILVGFRVNSDLHPRAGKIEVGNGW